jgi:hypothetical protein
VSLALLQQGGGFSPKRLRAMLLGVDKRRKGQDDAEEEEDGGDYGAVPRAHARSDAGDGGCFVLIFPTPLLAVLPAVADLVSSSFASSRITGGLLDGMLHWHCLEFG